MFRLRGISHSAAMLKQSSDAHLCSSLGIDHCLHRCAPLSTEAVSAEWLHLQLVTQTEALSEDVHRSLTVSGRRNLAQLHRQLQTVEQHCPAAPHKQCHILTFCSYCKALSLLHDH